jgi:hypothetical protein
MSASTLPPHLAVELHTPRAPRARMSPGPSSAGANSSPRGSPRTSERSGHAATDVEGILQAHGGDSGKAIEALLAERVSLVCRVITQDPVVKLMASNNKIANSGNLSRSNGLNALLWHTTMNAYGLIANEQISVS